MESHLRHLSLLLHPPLEHVGASMVEDDETLVVAPPAPGLSPVKMVLGLVVLIGLNYVFTDLLDESVRRSSPLRL